MIDVVGVRFKRNGKVYYFDPNLTGAKIGDDVIVETVRGLEYGNIVIDKLIDEESIQSELKQVVRIATDEDRAINIDNRNRAKEALILCEQQCFKHNLDMKLISSEYTFDNSKLLFYFTAEGRIDFRDLVKDLAAVFKTRIELRQIGVRDEAKTVGALGCCGRACCCSSFLSEFSPVSIKMAKDQGLSLNPTKVSGVCGRLMCCLNYEQEGYEELLKKSPHVGEIVETKQGSGTVVSIYTIQKLAKIAFKNGENQEYEIYRIDDLKRTRKYDKDFSDNSDLKEEEVDIKELKVLEKEM